MLDGVRVLIVDDVRTNRRLLERFCQKNLHCAYVSVVNGLEAVKAFALDRFHLILMDIDMPVMDGMAATRVVRRIIQFLGAKKHTFIIGLSANQDADIAQGALTAGMDAYFPKPYDPAVLLSTMQRLLGIRSVSPSVVSDGGGGGAARSADLAKMPASLNLKKCSNGREEEESVPGSESPPGEEMVGVDAH